MSSPSKRKPGHCLGFGPGVLSPGVRVVVHAAHAILTLHIGAGTVYHTEIPLCDRCATHPRVDQLLHDKQMTLS